MKVKCLALKPFLFQMTVLAIGELFSTAKGHATDLVADGLARYATDSDVEGLDERAQDLADNAQLDASDGGVDANEKNETQEKELTDGSDNSEAGEAPAAPSRKRSGSASKPARG